MSIAAISSNTQTQATLLQALLQESRAQFQKLAQDLQSGNLTAAQQDVAQLASNSNSSPSALPVNSSSGPVLPPSATLKINQELNTLGSDLKSGNISAAQQAYATLQQDLQASLSTPQGSSAPSSQCRGEQSKFRRFLHFQPEYQPT
jgi:HPt (histidine-containing phosphotransfer) domain-containing protein